MKRRGVDACVPLLLGLLACDAPVSRSEISEQLAALDGPNLVLIVVDTLRADWTTPYGFAEDTTPELARWADRGIVFERVRAQSSWTKISMASLFTSLWPRTHALAAYRDGLAAEAVTLADVLGDAGYRNYAVQTNGWLDQSFGFHQGFDRYVFPRGGGAQKLSSAGLWPHADRVLEEAARLIDAHDAAVPLFLYLHLMDVHEYASPREFRRFGTDDRGHYLASIAWTDDAVRRVKEKLDDAGLLDRTLMVVASDHGEAFGENGVQGHARNVLTSVLWVPLVIRTPFPVEPVRVHAQVRNLDLAPTLLDLVGLESPPSFEGQSLVPLISGREVEEDRPSFAGLGHPLYPDAAVQVSVNEGSWTFARNLEPVGQRGELLFDRIVDPSENVNLIDRESDEAGRLREILNRYLEGEAASEVLSTDVRIDPGIAAKLRAMGYFE